LTGKLEFEIQRDIMLYLMSVGIFAKRIATQGLRGGRANPAKGCPDILGVLPGGRSLMIEVKTKRGRLNADQEKWLHEASQVGALVIVAESLADVVNAIDEAV
jgi:Holliday junction resolvase